MKTRRWYIDLAALGLLTVTLSAQPPAEHDHYDAATEITIKGTVKQVNAVSHARMRGTHLTVQTDGNATEVALGPTNFLKRKGFTFAKGDAVEVTGAKATMHGKELLIAREVTRGDKTLTLRDKDGVPEWAGARGGQRHEHCCSKP